MAGTQGDQSKILPRRARRPPTFQGPRRGGEIHPGTAQGGVGIETKEPAKQPAQTPAHADTYLAPAATVPPVSQRMASASRRAAADVRWTNGVWGWRGLLLRGDA